MTSQPAGCIKISLVAALCAGYLSLACTTLTEADMSKPTSETSQETAGFLAVETGGAEGVIVPAELAAQHWRFSTGRAPEREWVPAVVVIEKLETELSGFLAAHGSAEAQAVVAKLETYSRQYLGVFDQGKHQVEVRGICATHLAESRFDWRTRVVQVDGGGDCFFEALYDVDAQQFTALSIHGES